jgi:hypothetical protein
MTTYTITENQREQLQHYLQAHCGGRCNNEYNPCEASDQLGGFEAWFKAKYHSRLDRKMADDRYNNQAAHMMCQAWQAVEGEPAPKKIPTHIRKNYNDWKTP